MDLDEWTRLVKQVGPSRFKAIGVAFLGDHYGCRVDYKDGTGDGGVDAWVVLSPEPLVRRAAQLHAGSEESWEAKLSEDVEKLVAYRGKLAPESAADALTLDFVCGYAPSAVKFAEVAARVRRDHDVVVNLFDARSIASQALEKRRVFELLSRELPGWSTANERTLDAREEALLAFQLFHEAPNKFRGAVRKAAVAAVLSQGGGSCSIPALAKKAGDVLGEEISTGLLVRTVRHLESEGLVERRDDEVAATPTLHDRVMATLAEAETDRGKLVDACAALLDRELPKAGHHRGVRAKKVAETLVMDLGGLVREATAATVEHGSPSRLPLEAEFAPNAHALRDQLGGVLSPEALERTLGELVKLASGSPFARRLAEAELFLRLTSTEASELAQVLQAEKLRVWLDASIAMPMMCAKYDRPAKGWLTSVTADALHEALANRGAEISVPSVYLEEIAWHLLKANDYAEVIGDESALARSQNFFVAHYCSTRPLADQSGADFQAFLEDFSGPPRPRLGDLERRRLIERSLRRILERYAIHVANVDDSHANIPLADEPEKRLELLLRHDRVVVQTLAKESAGIMLCTADNWLRGACSDREVIALDSAALADMVELARPAASPGPLVAAREQLAKLLGSDAEAAAAAVWDAIVGVEGKQLDRELVKMARSFRDTWLAAQSDDRAPANHDEIREAWRTFRDSSGTT
jgi:DNA-binding HxlR family transcriptional regulator